MNRADDLYSLLLDGGEPCIDELIHDRTSEELFLDFKASPDDGSSSKLAHSDRSKLAKAISGFGNSDGGLIVWGVDCDRLSADGDVARGKRPIQRPHRFKSWLEAAVSGCTLPAHQTLVHAVVPCSNDPSSGFVLTLVPKSMHAPLQCIVEPHRHRYFMRVGSNFEHVPHGLLAGMFGRQPLPHVFHLWKNYGGGMSGSADGIISPNLWPSHTPYISVGLLLRNEGLAVARDLYVNVEFGVPGPNCAARVSPRGNSANYHPWQYYSSFEHAHHFVSEDTFKLAPGSIVEPLGVEFYIRPPFDSPLRLKISFGCTGSPVNVVSVSAPAAVVAARYDTFLESDRSTASARAMGAALLQFTPNTTVSADEH